MKTVAEPKIRLDHLWGKPAVREGEIFRLMRYVIRFDHNGQVLLHNAVTGQLVLLDRNEKALLETLPGAYAEEMDPLIDLHFLVPADTDEHKQIAGFRDMLSRFEDNKSDGSITEYTILPTTACNARCYYCFEKGVQAMTMSEQTAIDTAAFIQSRCQGRKVRLRWFGGEPTVAANRISQICEELRRRGVEFSSGITTNGYLMDEEMAERARSLWRLESAKISVDGTEESYDRIKAYVNAEGSPYQRVMRNIGFLLERGVHVELRMNFDPKNHHEFKDLLREAADRYGQNPLLDVYVHQIDKDGFNADEQRIREEEQWYNEKILELNCMAREAGMLHTKSELPRLKFGRCSAASDSAVTILPNGKLVSCPEQLGPGQIMGDLIRGVTDRQLVRSWKRFADPERCRNCALFPACALYDGCSGKNHCFYKLEKLDQARKLAEQLVDQLVDTSFTKSLQGGCAS